MNRLQYIVVHCLLTQKYHWITKEMIQMWHMGPLDLHDGRVRYMGKIYKDRSELPLVKINGVWISKLHGRGWTRYGYRDIIQPDGTVENITPHNQDGYVDSNEITWGALGVNSISAHVALAGGIHPTNGETIGQWPFHELYTHRQWAGLEDYLKQDVVDYPWVKVIGHYQTPLTDKSCPNTHIPTFCMEIGLPEENYENVFKIEV